LHLAKYTLPSHTNRRIIVQFVVDNEWVTNSSAPQEIDSTSNVNNVLLPDQIKPKIENIIMSSVGPDATTVALAGDVPLEKKEDALVDHAVDATPSDVPGGFPETPAAAFELGNTVSVNPLPAAIGAVNPVDVRPGEPLPPTTASDNIHEHVKLDKESYEKADTLPGLSELPAVAGSMIPESSLPIQTAIVSNIHPNATTAQTSGHVPLDPEVPVVVQESQSKAGVDPEASANPVEVHEKAVVENELLEKVAPAPSTSEGTAGIGTEKSENSTAIGAAAATIGGAVLASALVAKDSIVAQAGPVVEQLKDQLPDSVKTAVIGQPETTEQRIEEVSPQVPHEVKDSIVESGKAPEAAANTDAVEAKKEVESELLSEAKASSEPLKEPVTSATTTHVSDQAPTLPEVNDVASPFDLPTFGESSKTAEAVPVEPPVVEATPKPVEVPSTINEVPPQAPAADAATTADEPSQAPTSIGEEEAPKLVEAPQTSSANAAALADTKPEGSQGSGSEKKKKHRLSTLFGKIKSRFTSPAHDSTPKQTTA
jgi:hypothetical protein